MKFLTSLTVAAVIAVASTGFAQEVKPEAVPEKPKINVTGRVFMEWQKELQHSSPTQTENINTFSIRRVYLDFRKKIDDIWSVRVTTDVGQAESKSAKTYVEDSDPTETKSTVESTTDSYTVFLKYAFVEAKDKLDFAEYKFQAGLIGTPLLGFVDKQSDYRWLEQNYADQARTLLIAKDGRGASIDASADLGVSGEIAVFNKMLTFTGAITNGEGFRRVNERQSGHDDGKAYYGMVTLTPLQAIKGLSLFGVYRTEDTNDKIGGNHRMYTAGGISYSDDWYKIGAMYLLPETKRTTDAGVVTENTYKLLDSWLHVRLDSIIGMPVIIVGRYAFGENDDVDKSKVTAWAAGIGYHLADGLRAMVYYHTVDNEALEDPDTNVFVKAEVNF